MFETDYFQINIFLVESRIYTLCFKKRKYFPLFDWILKVTNQSQIFFWFNSLISLKGKIAGFERKLSHGFLNCNSVSA